jgi:hypothetical protein
MGILPFGVAAVFVCSFMQPDPMMPAAAMEAAVVARKSRRDTFGLLDGAFMLLTSPYLMTDPVSAADPSPQQS